ncbi:MAG: dephospho-CoA kinase [Muribaculaceae bacterium]|nr:dephospho-CoA kinase [Muribaculaceae bacterium]
MLIAITGGIGSGKSIVSGILSVMGYPVYDADSHANRLVETDGALREKVIAVLGKEAYDALGRYDRKWVAGRVFANPTLLQSLDAVIHPAVIAHCLQWAAKQTAPFVFAETALLRQSGMAVHFDAIWRVTAPVDLRISRVKKRSNLSESQICSRIDAQNEREIPYEQEFEICNDGNTALLPLIVHWLETCNPSGNK